MKDIGQSGGLRVIFSFFLGLMLTALIGVGVYTFHQPPEQLDSEVRELKRREQAIRNSGPENRLTTADRDQIQEIMSQRNELVDAAEQARKKWALSASIILIVFATLAMAVSLVRTARAGVISNGLLLGGVFAMLYGVGWISTADTSITRFVVMTAAFLIALGLGYARFVRRGTISPAAVGSGIPEGGELGDIDCRVRDLEKRMDEAAQSLARRHDSSTAS
jgi:hypothetical protein